MLARAFHTLWLFSVALLFLSAATLTAARLWVPSLADYRHEIEKLASEALQQPVTIARIQGTWRGFNPVLKLKGVAVTDTAGQEDLLAIDEVWVGIDIMHYLYERQFRLASLDVIGTDVTVIRDAEGRIYIDRLDGGAGDAAAIAGLLQWGRISIHDSTVTFHDQGSGRPAYRFTDATLTLKNAGNRHILTGYVMLPGELGYRVDVTADLEGEAQHLDGWNGRFYVKGQSLAVSDEHLFHAGGDVDAAGVADVRCWVDMQSGRLQSVRGEIDISELRLRRADPAAEYAVDRFSGQFGWRKRISGWQFMAQQVVIEQAEDTREGTGFALAQRDFRGKHYLTGDFTRIYLQDLQPLLRLAPGVEAAQRRQIARLRPEGMIEELNFDAELSGDVPRVLGLYATFRGLGISPSGEASAIRGLRGTLTGTPEAGALWLRGKYVSYRDDSLFRDTLSFDHLEGEVAWQNKTDHLVLTVDPFRIENGDLALVARMDLELPHAEGAPRIDLQMDMPRGTLGSIRHYLPAGIMPVKGVNWLDRSLVSGDITDGRIVVQGPLDRLPFDQGEGRFEVKLPVTNAILDYNKDWTRIEQLDAQVNFTGRRMDVYSSNGRIRSTSLALVHAIIEDLTRPDLRLRGTVHGQLPVMLAELGSSPLGEIYGSFLDRVSSSGDNELELDVFVPLHGVPKRPIDVKGRILLKGNTLEVKDQGYSLDGIKGELVFTTGDLRGSGLRARLLNTPVRVDVSTTVGGGTRIKMHGPLDLVDLARQQQPGLESILSGKSGWTVLVAIDPLRHRNEVPGVDVEFKSSLEGVAVDLPEPFGKTAAEARPLKVRVDGVTRPDKQLRFDYSDVMAGVFDVRQTGGGVELQSGNLTVGGEPAILPDSNVLLVSGYLAEFSTTRWQPVFAGWKTGKGPPVRLDLVIDELEVMRHILRGVVLQAQEAGVVQNLKLSGPTIDGEVQLTRTGAGIKKVVVNLGNLSLEGDAEVEQNDGMSADPATFPDLDISINSLKYDGINLGQVQMQTRRERGTVYVDNLAVSSNMLKLRATGHWKGMEGGSVSHIEVEVSDGRLDKLLDEFDYREDVKGGDMSGTFYASWPGAPWDFLPEHVEGNLYLLIKDGQLLNVKPGAGRVFGLVSLHTLPRRLSLDFSDLFKKGFAFDKIKGNFVLDAGNAYTEDLYIDGPAARIEIAGRIGLVAQDYDELITVIPSMRSSLPLAGAIAGGPAVGAVLLLAEQVLGDRLQKATKFTRKQYAVTGPWSDPVYTKQDIKVEQPVAQEPEDIE